MLVRQGNNGRGGKADERGQQRRAREIKQDWREIAWAELAGREAA